MLILGLSGFIGSGKTTTSDWFIQNHSFRRLSFADPIRDMIIALGVPEEVLRDPVAKEQPHPLLLGRSPRFAMEELGTTWGRNIMHPQFWVGHFALRARKAKFVIVDDVRYPNEVEAIHELGGMVFKLIVPGQEPKVRTDFAVQTIVPDEALDNDMANGVTQKMLYGYIYDRLFQVPAERARARPGKLLGRLEGCDAPTVAAARATPALQGVQKALPDA